MFIRVLLLAALACAAGAQQVGFTLQTQYEDTKISNISCDTVQGFLTVTIFNGFTETREFYVSGQSNGVAAPLDPVPTSTMINGRTTGQLFLYGPSTGAQSSRGIVGVRSQVNAFMVDPLATSGVSLIGSKFFVCGGNYSSHCSCGFFHYFCQIDECSPDRFAWFWMVNDFFIILIVSVIGLFMVYNGSTARMRVNDHHAANMTRNVPTPDQLAEARFKERMHSKDMSIDDLRALRAELQQRVRGAEHQHGLSLALAEVESAAAASQYDTSPDQEGTRPRARTRNRRRLTVY